MPRRNPPKRFLVCWIDPQTGRERLGTGAAGQTYARYANVANVIRFHLAKPAFPAGQYNIYSDPEGSTTEPKFLTTAYKVTDRLGLQVVTGIDYSRFSELTRG